MAHPLTSSVTESTSNSKEFKKATVFLNIGYQVEMPDGTVQFVSLPFGLGLDNMSMAKTDTQNAEFNALNEAKNQLLQDLLEAAQDVNPGEGVIVNDLQLELRVKSQPAEAGGNNPYLKGKKFSISK